jgi:hypothetical protein
MLVLSKPALYFIPIAENGIDSARSAQPTDFEAIGGARQKDQSDM